MISQVLQAVLMLFLVAITAWVHEYAHYVTYKMYDGNPKFGFFADGLKSVPFVTPLHPDNFYWELFESDTKTAWIKQIVLSGSALLVTLFFGIFFTYLGVITQLDSLLGTGVANLALFVVNFFNRHSDGFKVILAFKHKENYVKYLKETDYNFTPSKLAPSVEKIQLNHYSKL